VYWLETQDKFMLDSNAYFNFLTHCIEDSPDNTEAVKKIKTGLNFISELTEIELVSTVGKYCRVRPVGVQQCFRELEDGTKCTHQYVTRHGNGWNKRTVKTWRKLLKDTKDGISPFLNVLLLPFGRTELDVAKRIINHSMIYNFGSHDAIIAATAKVKGLTVITSDKSLKSCLDACGITYWDAFPKHSNR
jgi:predicted nucleic acid-binding protein